MTELATLAPHALAAFPAARRARRGKVGLARYEGGPDAARRREAVSGWTT